MASITRYRGDTAPDRFTVTDTDGTALNVTGYSFIMTIDERLNPPDETTQIAQITGDLVTPSSGIIEFAPTSGDADQEPGTYYYDIQMTDGDGKLTTLAKDEYIFTQDITK